MTRNCRLFSVTPPRRVLLYGRQLSLQGGLKVTRSVGRIDPNPGVPPKPTTEIALHCGKSLTLVGVVLDLPKRPLRMETTRAEVVASAVSAKVHVIFT